MPRRKNPPDRDARGETRQKYVNRVKRELKKDAGSLPPRWDLLATWPNGLDRETWDASTHFWRLQHLKGKTSGTFYGRFPTEKLARARRSAIQIARALHLGYAVLQTGDMDFRIYPPFVSPAALGDESPELEGIPLIESNDACEQFNEQAAARGLEDQKFDSFRRWLWRHGVRKYRIGGRVWRDVAHINEVLREMFGDDAPVIRGSHEAPVVKERTTT